MRTVWLIVVAFIFSGCSSEQLASEEGFTVHMPEYADEEVDSSEDELDPAVAVAAVTREGEPVYSTSLAISLAEVALRREGVDYSERGVMVSYMEGVYTVVFEKPPSQAMGADFKVSIDAQTSRILKVKTKSE